jgi:hypothetical protein
MSIALNVPIDSTQMYLESQLRYYCRGCNRVYTGTQVVINPSLGEKVIDCPQCQAGLLEEILTCDKCGKKFPERSMGHDYCHECEGEEFDEVNRILTDCGIFPFGDEFVIHDPIREGMQVVNIMNNTCSCGAVSCEHRDAVKAYRSRTEREAA